MNDLILMIGISKKCFLYHNNHQNLLLPITVGSMSTKTARGTCLPLCLKCRVSEIYHQTISKFFKRLSYKGYISLKCIRLCYIRFGEERIERVIAYPDCIVTWHLAILQNIVYFKHYL